MVVKPQQDKLCHDRLVRPFHLSLHPSHSPSFPTCTTKVLDKAPVGLGAKQRGCVAWGGSALFLELSFTVGTMREVTSGLQASPLSSVVLV